jgi:hypothetical protein
MNIWERYHLNDCVAKIKVLEYHKSKAKPAMVEQEKIEEEVRYEKCRQRHVDN